MKSGIVLAALLVSFSASADYFKVGLGYGVGGDFEVEGNGFVQNGTELKNGMRPLLLAYGFEMMGDVAGELELTYSSMEYDTNSSGEKPTALNAAFNVTGQVPLSSVILSGGAGLTFGSFDPDASIFGQSFDKGTAFGLQFFGGLDFPLNEMVSLGGELRYQTTITKIDLGTTGNAEGTYSNTSVLFTAKFGM